MTETWGVPNSAGWVMKPEARSQVVLFSHSDMSKILWLLDCRRPGFPVLYYLPEFAQTHVHQVSDAIQPSHPLLPSSHSTLYLSLIRVFSNDFALHIRWPRYWSFSFSISPCSGYSGLVSFRIHWLELLAVQGALKSLLQYHNS